MSGLHRTLSALLAVLDKLEIRYAVGGSVAGSVHGLPRATMDIDLIADLSVNDLPEFVRLLTPDFYVDAGDIQQAIAHRRSFNLIHFESAFKADVFPVAGDPFRRTELDRGHFTTSRLFGSEPVEFVVVSAEDILLSKLAWYRAGGETSQQQWSDLQGILRTSGDRMDPLYLEAWAKRLNVSDLLDKLHHA